MTKKLNCIISERECARKFVRGMAAISFTIVILGEFAEWFGRLIGHILK
ncbi:hypothetical protein DI53_0700 [Sphingobacterium deserti]|uniref:Uncharacterized protein n=1 Tax=Sphingobacterium deserti TaxID=1229276 RepID=A0A0B8T3D1_9SPHI|nr:hypothetical protein DI53_0700 [Sphingobacterium deserti]